MFELKINQLVLDCAYCQQPLRPDQIRGQAYTVGEMKSPQSFHFFFPSSTSLLGLAVRWRPHLLWCLHPPTRKGMYLQLPFAGPHHRSDEVQMHLLRLWGRIHPLLQVFLNTGATPTSSIPSFRNGRWSSRFTAAAASRQVYLSALNASFLSDLLFSG